MLLQHKNKPWLEKKVYFTANTLKNKTFKIAPKNIWNKTYKVIVVNKYVRNRKQHKE